MQQASWQGSLWLAPDFAILHGAAGATDSHAHYAHQLMLSTGAPFTAQRDGVVHTARHLLVDSLRPHAIVAAPSPMLTIYAEPQRLGGAALLAAAGGADAPTPDGIAAALQAQPRLALADARVQRALDRVDALLSGKVSAAAVAEAAHLSLSQLERLFSAQLGLPVRRLVLWRRLRLAIRFILLGSSLTEAAHGAGFADAAHFSRTMRSLFGVRADRSLRQLKVTLLD
ncbi:AraC family transcriptional regulator [Janthinobacterium sp. BJB1]|uniref:helix-turn-helix domain-containing protein n=1 Tax=Janthinobacterium sp. GW458P TaxID=1981504 RepID=UPI000A3258B6|nr:AraC family transcriptional regulator [Janthinobacterium sp. GW458P]MBE3027498.1 helix-turn-helix transcriptional regulator [Janthinobacterium sp. GW458P]PHV15636.1 AraC family transcriptional regulator [Janthinobacterium sp. BJB303]PJC96569.1 AraC family transcriptional regulator [Janthinobacterium sp. BJB1]